jgi:DNA invertase Pin-like site-specific DNA recombinase
MEHQHPTGAAVGYARTSTTDQVAGLESQIADLKAAGCTRIFS